MKVTVQIGAAAKYLHPNEGVQRVMEEHVAPSCAEHFLLGYIHIGLVGDGGLVGPVRRGGGGDQPKATGLANWLPKVLERDLVVPLAQQHPDPGHPGTARSMHCRGPPTLWRAPA